MRRAKLGVLAGALGMAAFTAAWWVHRPGLDIVQPGVTPMGVSVGRDVPARFGKWSALDTPGYNPLRFYFTLPSSARALQGARAWEWRDAPPKDKVAARLVLPNGSATPVDLQREWLTDRARIDLFGDLPPNLDHVDFEIFVPGRPTARLRAHDLPTATLAFDVHRRVTAQGLIKGEAWWQPQEPGSPAPALFSRLNVTGFSTRPGEVGELHYRTFGPFAEPGHEPWVRFGSSSKIDARRSGVAGWVTTPYAGYAKALHSTGTVRRYRVFDETIDFGTAALHPRRRHYGSLSDAAPVLTAPRAAATPGGLRLTVSNRSLEDDISLAIGMAVSMPFDVDRSSVTRGLPPDMAKLARNHPVEISIKPVSRKEDWFTAVHYDPRLREPNVVYPRYVTFNDFEKGRISSFSLRFRVRRQVLVEETPFDLTVPVVGPRHTIKYHRGMANGVF